MHHTHLHGYLPHSTVRLESIILGEVTRKLTDTKKLVPTREFATWTRLNLGLLSTLEKVGYATEIANTEWTSKSSPIVTRDAFDILTSFLVSGGLLDKNEMPQLINERSPMLTDLVPMVVRKAIDSGKLTIDQGLSFLETINLFSSNIARPIPGSWLDQYCQENPTAPIGLVARAGFHNYTVLRERANLGFVALAEHFKLLDASESVSVLKALHGDLGVHELALDMTIGQAEVILETAGLGEHLPKIRHLLADARAGYVVDGQWAEICNGSTTPQISTLIHQMPVGRAVIDSLVSHKIIEKSFIKSLVHTMVGGITV
jgi:hypothetical protein